MTNRDLQSRIAADISDYCDLIVRKASNPIKEREGQPNKRLPVNK